jgi:hypothetical protein
MTDSIDLDEIETKSEKEPEPNHGDWFWRGKGDVESESETVGAVSASESEPESEPPSERPTTPHVPHKNRNKPVGVPEKQGGAGGTSAREAAASEELANAPEPSGPHGGGADEMTMAVTYEAAKRFADPGFVFASAMWADWVGIVGEVPSHVINNFQRSNGVDADFFNGTGTGPAERLAEITEMSMFFAERMVVLGCPGEEWIAEEAGWEFVSIDFAAEKAGWELD